MYILPNILIIVLKRFDSDERKLVSKMDLPQDLDLTDVLDRDGPEQAQHAKYTLQAVVAHIGSHLRTGHYVAHVRNAGKAQRLLHCCKSTASRNLTSLQHDS